MVRVIFLTLLILSTLGIPTAQAASLKGYEALPVQVPSSVSLKPGEAKTVTIKWQNLGPNTWSSDGAGFVSIYTYGPKYRSSVFQSANWYQADQPAKLKEKSVKAGEVGTIELTLTAPQTAGSYSETFNLAAEDIAWIPGGEFTLKIEVQNTEVGAIQESPKTVSNRSEYQAEIVATSGPSIKAKGGVTILYTVQLKNTGDQTWGTRRLQTRDVRIAGVSTKDFKHKSWKSSSVVLEQDGSVKPGEVDTLTFAFTAPKYKGSYTASFQIAVDGEEVEGGLIDIPVEVTSDSPEVLNSPQKKIKEKKSKKKESADGIKQNIVIDEPTIRVGILIVDEETDDKMVVRSEESAMQIVDIDGKVLAEVEQKEEVEAYYKDGKYYYDVGSEAAKSKKAIRFVPAKKNGILTIVNFDRRETRGSRYADNQFRDVLEIRYNNTKDRVWMINELPMETYLKGLAETSNDSHIEFQKALITAARTYAYYHFQRATKHDAEYFHVDAYVDQVYKGYGQEARTPKLSEAADATRGVTVTYQGQTAITPYFSRSDGRTRDWSEVWYGDVAWAKSVPVPCDKGKTLWGHGVGMSASGALCMANDGQNFQQILHHFYTGVDLEKRWR